MINYQEPVKGFTLGGKANGLFKLKALGIPVPPFLVIPAEMFDAALNPQLNQTFNPAQARQQLSNFILPTQALEEIKGILTSWNFPLQPVVVRSSVADEDSAHAAFAGMMDSFMNVTRWPDVEDAIAKCAVSAYSERALAYREQKNIPEKARPAVIIQQQILPEASGVLFTTFPEYPQELAVHATWGFGESLVSGRVAPDEFYFLKKEGKLHRSQVADKMEQLVAQELKGLSLVPVATEKREKPCLAEAELNYLFAIGSRLEKAFDHPQDIEFVVQEGRVFIVQCRPITQKIPQVIVYDNSNIQESYCGVTTPLTFSFASRAYATVYRQTMHTLGLPAKTIEAQEPVITQLLGLVKGRIYYNINNWYRGLQLLPAFKQNKADMERMMGLEEPVDFVQNVNKTTLKKIRLLPGLAFNLVRLLWAFQNMPQLVQKFHSQFQAFYSRFYEQDFSHFSGKQLWEQKEKLDAALLQKWTTPILNDFKVMMANGAVNRSLKKLPLKSTDDLLSRLLSGAMQLESTQPTWAMQRLAAKVRQEPSLQQLLNTPNLDWHNQVKNRYPWFYQEVADFINQFGDRTVGELKLETQTMRVAPDIFYKYLRNYIAPGAELPVSAQNNLHQEAEQELKDLIKNIPGFQQKKIWRRLHKLQKSIAYRESLRLERTRLFGMYRTLYRAMGEVLARNQNGFRQEDVFYLTEQEIAAALDQPVVSQGELVKARRLEFDLYKKEEVASRVVIPSPPVPDSIATSEKPDWLQGTGCYQGVISGKAVVITEPTSDLDVRGKIICALRTDPGWAALFPACRGVLIEKGSSLSHSVIILRELGIPTIINIPNLTKVLETGTQLLMDGSSGKINLITDEQHATSGL